METSLGTSGQPCEMTSSYRTSASQQRVTFLTCSLSKEARLLLHTSQRDRLKANIYNDSPNDCFDNKSDTLHTLKEENRARSMIQRSHQAAVVCGRSLLIQGFARQRDRRTVVLRPGGPYTSARHLSDLGGLCSPMQTHTLIPMLLGGGSYIVTDH